MSIQQTLIQPGIYPNLSNDDYHAHNSISRSKLMDFAVSPYTYWAMHINPNRPPKRTSKAFEIGQALHDFILQPKLFEKEYDIEPKKILLKNTSRREFDAYKNECAALELSGKIILSFEDYKKLDEMRDRILNYKEARELIEGARYEESYFWIDPETELLIKTKPDILHHNMSVDFKTTRDASSRAFKGSIIEYGYHIQAATVREGRKMCEQRHVPDFINLCIEKEYPYHIGIYIMEEEAIDKGHEEYRQLLVDLQRALAHNEWPDYPIETIGLPRWAV
jgi:hypothetical protein